MRIAARSMVVLLAALMGAVLLTFTTTYTAALSMLATTALIVPGTGTPDPGAQNQYMQNAIDYYITPNATSCGAAPCAPEAVPYTAQFWPFPFPGWGGLSGAKWNDSVASGVGSLNRLYGAANPGNGTTPVVIFGYSQGATVAGIVKGQLAADNPNGMLPAGTQFVLIGDPQRPNGGVFERLAILGTVPILDATFGNPTPTNTAPGNETNTTDIAFQYDGVADFPTYPINALADLNAVAGFEYVHGYYLVPDGMPPTGALPYGYTKQSLQDAMAASANRQTYGDTVYITIPARALPIMTPFLDLGTSTGTSALVNPVVALLQPATQTLIETGYDRTSYGTPTPFKLIPIVNPITLGASLLNDIPEGIDAAGATIQSPTHTIPNLPPSWGSDPTPFVAPNDTTMTTLAAPQDPITPGDNTVAPTPPTTTGTSHRTLTPVNLFAKPNVLLVPGQTATNPFGTSLTNPLGANVHPIRDVAAAAEGAVNGAVNGVKKALGVKDASASSTSSSSTSNSNAG